MGVATTVTLHRPNDQDWTRDSLAIALDCSQSLLMPSSKALMLCSSTPDGDWLSAEFERRDWDAEAVTDFDRFQQAVQWWKPDVVLVSVDASLAWVISAAGSVGRLEPTPVFFLFGARPPAVLKRIREQCGIGTPLSTIEDMLPLVDAACAAVAAKKSAALDGPAGFADFMDTGPTHPGD